MEDLKRFYDNNNLVIIKVENLDNTKYDYNDYIKLKANKFNNQINEIKKNYKANKNESPYIKIVAESNYLKDKENVIQFEEVKK